MVHSTLGHTQKKAEQISPKTFFFGFSLIVGDGGVIFCLEENLFV